LGFTFIETPSCIPGHACGSATSRYAVLGTSRGAIPAFFHYNIGDNFASIYSVLFHATDLNGSLLARARARGISDEGSFEATSCGPQPGSCVSLLGTSGPGESILPSDGFSLFPRVSEDQFGGVVTQLAGSIPLYLPVGPGTGISAGVTIDADIFSFEIEFCRSNPGPCSSVTSAVFSLEPLPPSGARFLEPVPEPTTLLLMGTTAAGFGLARWRQRRRKQHEP
jgi:hypothetical protein